MDPGEMVDLEAGFSEDDTLIGEVGFEGWEPGIAIGSVMDPGQVEVGAAGEKQSVDLGSATDPDWPWILLEQGPERGGVGDGSGTGSGEAGTGKDDGVATGQRATDGFEGASTHDQDAAEGGAFEPFEIGGEMPGNAVLHSDDAVVGHGRDGIPGRHGGRVRGK